MNSVPSIRFLGGLQAVTGSHHLLETRAGRFLLDCGLFQGRRDEYYDVNSRFALPPEQLSAIVLSHAHIDHSGNLPTWVRGGFSGSIYTTPATRDLCSLMLPDSGHIQEEDVRFVNKIRQRKGEPPRYPLYTEADARLALPFFRDVPYLEPREILPGVRLTFCDAGHVLGLAISVLEIDSGNGRPVRIAYAVDLGRRDLPLLRDPMVPQQIDYLVIESTYGDRAHDSLGDNTEKLAAAVRRTIDRGGKVVIPSFALERTQLVLYMLRELREQNRIPQVPIFVDSPLACGITEVFERHLDCLDNDDQRRVINGGDLFGEHQVRFIRDVEESKELNAIDEPMIIISASGMCESGRVLHHLRNTITNGRNTVIVVGFMAEYTLGRRLVERRPTIRIFGEEHPLRAEIVTCNAFSAHADQPGLVEYVQESGRQLRGIFLVHGESARAAALAERLQGFGCPVTIPAAGDQVELA